MPATKQKPTRLRTTLVIAWVVLSIGSYVGLAWRITTYYHHPGAMGMIVQLPNLLYQASRRWQRKKAATTA